MIIGYKESKDVDGRFYEYQYETTVLRTPMSEHFGCFKDNDIKEFKIVQFIYCHSDKDFEYIVQKWREQANGLLSMYSYKGLGKTQIGGFTAPEVVDRIYIRNNFKYLANMIEYGAMVTIQ